MTGIVVTGASSGIGRAIALELSRRAGPDATTLVHYRRNADGAGETAAMIRDAGGRADVLAADLADAKDVARFADAAFDRLGGIQTWVNNAGADVLTGDAADWSFDQKLDRLWNVDVRGTMALSRIVGPRLVAQSRAGGRIPSMVFLGWDQAATDAGMEGDAGLMFGPIKAAVMSFAMSLAQTLAPDVRVNTIAPGWIQTAWGETTRGYWHDRATGQSLMGRWGSPADIAIAAAYVADPANTFLTGQTIHLNGGFSRRFVRPE